MNMRGKPEMKCGMPRFILRRRVLGCYITSTLHKNFIEIKLKLWIDFSQKLGYNYYVRWGTEMPQVKMKFQKKILKSA